MADQTKDFLGSGWKFPPRLDVRGQIELAHQEQDVDESIRIILGTNRGERPMRPDFGSQLFLLQFAPNDASTAGLARRYVQEALELCEPRISVAGVNAYADPTNPARLLINVQYRVRSSNSDRNLVFPFYVIPGE